MRPHRSLAACAFAITLLAVCATGAGAQGFHSLYTRDGSDVWAVGDAGLIYRSYDSGTTWSSYTLGAQTLRGVIARGYNVVVVSDSGKIWRSTDSGGNWALTALSGAPDLRGLDMPSAQVGYAVGAGGAIVKTTDGGGTWSPQASGTGEALRAVRFANDLEGWAAGLNGTVLHTTDGGANWSPVSVPTTNHLLAIDVRGSTVWIVGDRAAALKSTNGGGSFAAVNLKFDARADVRSVYLASADSVYLTGGGGFVRLSIDGGHTWTFQSHKMQAQTTDICFYGPLGWATNLKNGTIIYTLDGGNFWRVPTNTNIGRSWSKKYPFAGNTRGNPFALNGASRSVYCALGNIVVKSLDEGNTWSTIASFTGPQNVNRVNAFLVSPKDSLVMLAATKSTTLNAVVYKTIDGGANWTATSSLNFSEYGPPLEMDPDKPDTVYFGVDVCSGAPPLGCKGLYRSTDFGSTWSLWTMPTSTFRSPCDIQVVPDSSNIIIVGDGVTGSGVADFFKSTDGGLNFTLMQSGTGSASEIPGIACSRLKNNAIFATMWSGGGTFRSTNYGTSFPSANPALGSMWGIDVSRDDPNCVMAGQYSGGQMILSLDGTLLSNSHIQTTISGENNYAFLVPDRATVLNLMSLGIWKMNFTYTYSPLNTQSMNQTIPSGGESWAAGTNHGLFWSASNIALARLEYQTTPGGAWKFIADVPGYASYFDWTVPYDASSQVRVRVRDAWDGVPADSSAVFTITAPMLAVSPPSLAFGPQTLASSTQLVLTLQNTGNLPLSISSIQTGAALAGAVPILASGGSAYTPGRTTIALGVGQSDTLGVTFAPELAQSYPDSLVITSNAGPPRTVQLSGEGIEPFHLTLSEPIGGEQWQYGTQHPIIWSSTLVNNVAIEYQKVPAGAYVPIVASVPAVPSAYTWTIPNDPTNSARVRIRQIEGPGAADSGAVFSLTVPEFLSYPDPVELSAPQNGFVTEAITIENNGTAPLTVSSATVDDARFHVGRTSLVIPAGDSDTLGITYLPGVVVRDTALLTLVTDDPSTPHTIVLHGEGNPALAVSDGRHPVAFAVSQNRPNPFARTTRIAYALPVAARVRIDVFNLQGQRVATLVDGEQPAGNHTVPFGTGVSTAPGDRLGAIPAGVYFYRFQAGAFAATRKMLVLQ